MVRWYYIALAYVAANVVFVVISFDNHFRAWSPIDALYFFTFYGPPSVFMGMAIAAIVGKERPQVWPIIVALTGLLVLINYSMLWEACAAV